MNATSVIAFLAALGVVLLGAYCVALGAIALLRPASAKRFLLGFASSPTAHYAELVARLLAGGALVTQAPRMAFPAAFSGFGYLLLATTSLLLLVPWRWHRQFAQHAVPRALRHLGLLGISSLVLGATILAALARGSSV